MTHAMVKGSNVRLSAASLRAVLCWPADGDLPDVDVSALLLGEDGKVRSDEDFVFYNQPQHPAEPVRHLSKQEEAGTFRDALEVTVGSLGPTVDRVLLAASADGGTFAGAPGLHLLLYPSDGEEPLVRFDIEAETDDQNALLCGEFYRRGDDWKFRALGQGYDTGLIGLATHHGISIESDEDTPPADGPPSAPGEDPDATVVTPPPPPQEPAPAGPTAGPDDDFPLAAPVPPPPNAPAPPAQPPSVPAPASHGTQAAAAAFTVTGSDVPAAGGGAPAEGSAGPTQELQGGSGYPQPPQHPPSVQPAYGYPQPAYGYPQPDPNFQLPPQGPQFIGR